MQFITAPMLRMLAEVAESQRQGCPWMLPAVAIAKLRPNSMCKPQITCEAWRIVRKKEEIK